MQNLFCDIKQNYENRFLMFTFRGLLSRVLLSATEYENVFHMHKVSCQKKSKHHDISHNKTAGLCCFFNQGACFWKVVDMLKSKFTIIVSISV